MRILRQSIRVGACPDRVRRRHRRAAGRTLMAEQLEPRMLLAGEVLEFKIQFLQPGTMTPLPATISKGTDFEIGVFVQDLRGPDEIGVTGDRGVFSAMLDLHLDKSLAAVEIEEIQRIKITGNPTGGSFTLSFNDGTTVRTTPAISYLPLVESRVAIAGRIQTALAALSNIGAGNVEVIPSLSDPLAFEVRFQGARGDRSFALMTGNPAGLTGGTNPAIQISQVVDGTYSAEAFRQALRRYQIVGGQLVADYNQVVTGRDAPDRIDDAGGVHSDFFTGHFPDGFEADPRLLFRVRMNALEAGDFAVQGSVADIEGEILLYSQGDPEHSDLILPEEIKITNPPPLRIIEPFSAIADTFTFDEDAAVTTLNVTANDTTNSTTTGLPLGGLPTSVTIVSLTNPTLGGTVSINTGAKTLSYRPALNASGTETFTYTLRHATTGVTDTATVTVNLTAVNDAPVNTVPGAQSVNEDTPLVFFAPFFPPLAVGDVDVGDSEMLVSLTAANGNLTLSGTSGLTFVSGANGTRTMSFLGTRFSINTALNGLTYLPDEDFAGSDTLQIVSSDLGSSGSGGTKSDSDAIAITINGINDAPVIIVPDSQQATESIPLVLQAIAVADVDLSGANAQITLSVDGSGTLTLATTAGLTNLVGNGTSVVSFQGTLTQVSAALNGVVYVAPLGDGGARTLTVRVEDNGSSGAGGEKFDQETFAIHVALLERPFARDDAFTVAEDSLAGNPANHVAVLDNDFVDAGNVPVLVDFTQPAHGTVTRDENGTPGDLSDDKLIYVPTEDFFGTDTFTYRLNQSPDAKPEFELDDDQTGIVTVMVTNAPDAAAANDDLQTTNEDTFVDIAALANDSDVDLGVPPESQTPTSATHAVIIVSQPSHGSFAVNANGTVRYTPALNYSGSDSFTYKLNDGALDSNVASVEITINAVNDAPLSAGDSYSTNQDTPLVVSAPGVLANDSDVDGPSIAVSGVTQQPTKGSLTLLGDGSFTYTPNAGVSGSDTFKYRATDGSLLSGEATVTIRINANPAANDDSFTSIADIAGQSHTVLANDSFAPDVGETLTITHVQGIAGSATTNQGGTIAIAADGKSLLYTPAAGFVGSDTYAYTISDSSGGADTATVTVNVIAFVATDITGAVYIDTDNDSVIDAAERRLAGVEIHLQGIDFLGVPVNVTVQTDINGQYVLPAVKPGSYTVSELAPEHLKDGKDRFDTAALGSSGLPIIKTVGNDTFTIEIPIFGTQDPSHTLEGNNFGEGGFVTGYVNSTALNAYTSTNNLWLDLRTDNVQFWQARQQGWDNLKSASFDWTTKTLTVLDDAGNMFSRALLSSGTLPRYRQIGGGSTVNKLVRIEGSAASFGWILQPAGSPRAVADSYVADEDQILLVLDPAGGVLANDVDPDSPALAATLVANASHGTVALLPIGTFVYTPEADYNGPDSFTYQASDGALTSLLATVNITVNPVNDDPTAAGDSFLTLSSPGGQWQNVLVNDTFVPDVGETLTVTLVGTTSGAGTTEQGGTVSIAADGQSVLYTPPASFLGIDHYEYTVSDGNGGTDTAVVTVDVREHIPTDISGVVYQDTDNDSVVDAAERRLTGVEINLQGTDFEGTPVSVTVQTDINGQYLFPAVKPGSYTVRELQPEHLKDGKDRFSTTALGTDGLAIIKTLGNDFFALQVPLLGTQDPSHTLSNNNFGEGGFVTGYVNSTALRAYTSTNNLWLDLRTDNVQFWQARQQGWDNLKSASFDWITKTLTVLDDAGNTFSRALLSSGTLPRYRQIGGGSTVNKLVRIEGSAADFGWILQPAGAPRAAHDSYAATEDQALVVLDPLAGVLANDIDPDSPTLSAVLDADALHGTVALQHDGTFTYTPDPDYSGPDSFTYRADDGALTSLPATVNIAVSPVNDDPTAASDSFLAVNGPGGQWQNVLVNDTSAPDSGETLSITSAGSTSGAGTTEQGGTVSIAPDGKSVLYTPLAGFLGIDNYEYTISDGSGGTDTAIVTVEVTDYIPIDITGVVYQDTDNDNVIDAAERRLAGVEINLQGTDFEGTPVDVTVQTDIDGQYVLPAVKPGSYTVRELQPENLLDGKDRFSTTASGADGLPIIKTIGNDSFTLEIPTLGTQDPSHALAGNNFGERGFVTGFINSTALSAYTSASNLWLNVRIADSAQLWQARQQGWANLKIASFDWATKTLTVEDLAGNTFSRVLLASGVLPRYRVIGGAGTAHRLIRIEGSAANFGWTLSATPLPSPEGEGDYANDVDALMGAMGSV